MKKIIVVGGVTAGVLTLTGLAGAVAYAADGASSSAGADHGHPAVCYRVQRGVPAGSLPAKGFSFRTTPDKGVTLQPGIGKGKTVRLPALRPGQKGSGSVSVVVGPDGKAKITYGKGPLGAGKGVTISCTGKAVQGVPPK